MADAELIEQLRAQVMSLRSPRSQQLDRSIEGGSSNSGESGQGGGRPQGAHAGKSRTGSRLANPVATDSPIILNVGGILYTTSADTLKAVDSSYFSLMLNGVWEPSRTKDGHIFVDRNGKLFEYVLEYLRDHSQADSEDYPLPDDLSSLRALKREADFYLLPALVARISKIEEVAEGGERDKAETTPKQNWSIEEKEQFEKERYERDTETESSVFREGEVGTEFDVAYSAVTSHYPQFSEEKIQELVSRINYLLTYKFADGFKIKDVNSGMVLDHAKQPPYAMYLQIVLTRDRKPGQPGGLPLDKPRPPVATSSAFVTSGHTRPSNHPPPNHGAQDSYQYAANTRRSAPDTMEHYGSESEGRYVESRQSQSPRVNRIPRPLGGQFLHDGQYPNSGAMGSPINDHDPNFSIVPQGYGQERPAHMQGSPQYRQQQYGDGGRGYDSGGEQYDNRVVRYEPRGGHSNGPEQIGRVLSPTESYQPYGNPRRMPGAGEQRGRESPALHMVNSNIPRLNLGVIGGKPNGTDGHPVREEGVNGRGPIRPEMGRHGDGWGNNHPSHVNLSPMHPRIPSPHPDFD
ncbi:hypothetical protein BSKO_01812 [Bryopsis sp. KO-2023]|nr:hypothetical protein BSKO_01812 [Bryopsis sp. KO-2023]